MITTMIKKMRRELGRLHILQMGVLASWSPCLAMRWGLVGIMAARVTSDDPRLNGLPLGVVMALQALDRQR